MTDMVLPTTLVQSFMQSTAYALAARLVRSNLEVALKHSFRAMLSL